MTAVVVGLDVGTSSSKAVAVTADGTVVATRVAGHEVDQPQPGWFEQDARAIWWEQPAALLRSLMTDDAVRSRDVHALAVSGMGPCVVLADSGGSPITPGILYGIDTRATAEIDELAGDLGADRIRQRTGSPLTSQAVGPKLLWLRRHRPDAWAAARMWFGPASFLVHRLTDHYVVDHHTASQSLPLYDVGREDWASDWVDRICDGLPMPALAWSDQIVGEVTARAAQQTGLPVGVPVLAGTVDAWAEAHSVGVRASGDMMLMYGSTMFLIAVSDQSRGHRGLWLTAGLKSGSRTLAAGMATSGLLTSWVAETTNTDLATLSAQAQQIAPGCDGLVLLPYFAGERSPLFDPGARGAMLGLGLQHTPAHLLRAAYEGIAMGIRHNLESFGESVGPAAAPWRAVAVGGGATAQLWTQVVSDVIGLPQLVPEVTVGAAYGDALLAACAVGLVDHDTDWTRTSYVVEPRANLRDLYDARYAVYRELYVVTRPLLSALSPGRGA